MEGDIKVVKKQGPGTLLRFYLVFGTPSEAEPDTPRYSLPVELENAKVYISIFDNHQQYSLDSLGRNCLLVSPVASAGVDIMGWVGPGCLAQPLIFQNESHDGNCYNPSH